MDQNNTTEVLTHDNNDTSISAVSPPVFYETEVVDDDESIPVSKFTPPMYIEMGDEEPEDLESLVNEKTDETVKADKDWSLLRGTRSIDTSVVAGFMFQTDAGIGCSITMTENGNRPIRILIDDGQQFGMYLVMVLRHEKWTTSGRFYLRFLRRVPVPAKRCTARMKEPRSDSDDSMIIDGDTVGMIASWHEGTTGDTTVDEDFRAIGAAGLREKHGGDKIPPKASSSTE